jgi:predicted phosphoribosyltransferase
MADRTLFRDRRGAGRVLAGLLERYRGRPDVVVLGQPRGGVPVAHEVATALGAPLGVFLVRKLGVPGHEEVAMGRSPAAGRWSSTRTSSAASGSGRRPSSRWPSGRAAS